MKNLLLLTLSCFIGFARLQSTTLFHTTFSSECTETDITKTSDCPVGSNSKRRWNVTNISRPRRYDRFTRDKSKCYYRVVEVTQQCLTTPTCVMTAYKYDLPRPSKRVKTTRCNDTFSIETECGDANGLKNMKAVYSECFTKSLPIRRSYCRISFQPCKYFQWTKFKLRCYAPCRTSSYNGLARQMVRKCKVPDGRFVNEQNCDGGIEAATATRKCQMRSKVKPDAQICDNTINSTMPQNKSKKSVVSQPAVTSTPSAKDPSTTTITMTRSTAAKTEAEESTITSAQRTIASHTPKFPVSFYVSNTSFEATSANKMVASPKILLPVVNRISQPSRNNGSFPPDGPGVSVSGKTTNSFDLVAVAGGAGAGLLIVLLMILIIVLLVRRRDHKSTASNSIISSTSSYRTKSVRNPVVDSSSFRIATWIRERPSLPDGGSLSPSESVVSDAEYWKGDDSVDDLTARYVQDQKNGKPSQVPDLVRNASGDAGEDHSYDDVYSSGDDEPAATSNRSSTPIMTRPLSMNQSQLVSTNSNPTAENNAVYAAAQRSRRKEQLRKRLSSQSIGAARRRIASQHSVTNLNGRQLRDGVLQIEFDDEHGVKCKLSESDTYMDLEEDGLPPVF